ncbi:MAG: ribulose-phosphate 3-epimerase [Elusimicrobiales bacterium]
MTFHPPSGRTAIVPSVLAADAADLGRAAEHAELAGADWLQVDVMDGHFVPNISFGPAVVAALRRRVSLPLDAHLMVERPLDFVEAFVKAGADLITVHYEAKNCAAALDKIHQLGAKAGLALNPDTPLEKALRFLPKIDLLLVMTVNPGFGGQAFMPQSPERIAQARRMINDSGRKIWLQVDGGINARTARMAALSGADSLVAGSAVFGPDGAQAAMRILRKNV